MILALKCLQINGGDKQQLREVHVFIEMHVVKWKPKAGAVLEFVWMVCVGGHITP